MKKSKLKLILEMDLDMIEIIDEFEPDLKEVRVKITGPEESKRAAENLKEKFDIILPYLFADVLQVL